MVLFMHPLPPEMASPSCAPLWAWEQQRQIKCLWSEITSPRGSGCKWCGGTPRLHLESCWLKLLLPGPWEVVFFFFFLIASPAILYSVSSGARWSQLLEDSERKGLGILMWILKPMRIQIRMKPKGVPLCHSFLAKVSDGKWDLL